MPGEVPTSAFTIKNLLKHYAKREFELREGSLTALLDYDPQHNGSDHSTTITMLDAGRRLAKKS